MGFQRVKVFLLLLVLTGCQSTVPKDWYQPSEAHKAKAIDDYNQVMMRNLYDAYAFVPTTGIKVAFSGGDLIFNDKHYPYGTFDVVLSDGQCRTLDFHPVHAHPEQQNEGEKDKALALKSPQHVTFKVCYDREALTMTAINFDQPIVFYQVTRWHQGVDYHPISIGWPNRLNQAHVFVQTVFSAVPLDDSA